MERKLAVIMAADVAGYSRLMAADEEGTRTTLMAYRAAIADIVGEHSGRIFGTAGDSVVVEFASAVQAVRAAVAIQRALNRRNADLPEAKRMEFRIGINLGDVMVETDDILGDAVNVAARLQEVAATAGICIADAVRAQVEGKLEFKITPLGERTLKNIPKPVAAYRIDWQLDDVAASGVLGGTLALPDKPSIAVLPFTNMGGDPEQEYFADGITEDIITALARYRWFFVIARNSTFVYKGRAVDIKLAARELGVRYVLEGSVRRAGNRMRITAQLIEAESGNHIWAEKYDRDVADVFALQDELTDAVVGAIEPEMMRDAGKRLTTRPADNLHAYDLVMRALWHFYQLGVGDNNEAEPLLRRALALDPKLSRAHMGLARILFGRCHWGWSKNLRRDAEDGYAAALTAVALDDRDPYCHYILSLTSVAAGKHAQALAEAQRAVDLSPNFALAYFALGMARICIGHFKEAIDPLLRCQRLSPTEPMTFEFINKRALAHYHMGDYQEALQLAGSGLRSRRMFGGLLTVIASLGQLGRADEARDFIDEVKAIKFPDFGAQLHNTFPYADSANRQQLFDGLAKAGYQLSQG